jgi:hypothetical protein
MVQSILLKPCLESSDKNIQEAREEGWNQGFSAETAIN